MPVGSRLYQLKSWLTLEDAAAHLSTVLSEAVATHDLLHLGLEERLKLSVLFLGPTHAIEGKIIHKMDTPVLVHSPEKCLGMNPVGYVEQKAVTVRHKTLSEILTTDSEISGWLESGALVATPMAPEFGNDTYIVWQGDIVPIGGVWDLPLLSGEKVSVEELYSAQVGGDSKLDARETDGVWIEREGRVYALMVRPEFDGTRNMTIEQLASWESRHYNPIHWYSLERLPSESRIVIRRQNLDVFIESLERQEDTSTSDHDNLRNLEAFGLLVELYASQHGPDYLFGKKPKVSRIVKDMLDIMPDDITSMGDRKLKEHVGLAIKAWVAKKQR